MNEREALIAAIAADPDDDTARLAFADWLQERGGDARAEFIRLRCASALRSPPPDEHDEYEYGYHRTDRDPDEPRAVDLLMSHWAEWFGGVLGAVGMPEPGPTVAPKEAAGVWQYPPYALDAHMWPVRHLPIAFAREFNPRRRRRKPPKRFLNSLLLDRGFVVGLTATLAHATPRCSLAAALRLEPITRLDLWVPPGSDHWARLSHPLLARVRELKLTATGADGRPDFPAATGGILNDPALVGVRSLALLVQYDYEDYYAAPAPLNRTEVENLLASPVARGLHALRTGIEPGAAAAFAETEPLPDLRVLSLDCRGPGAAPVPLPLDAYRDRLERLTLSEWFDATALGSGRPWARLAELCLHGPPITAAGCSGLAEPATFPALARLRITSASASATAALADALRAGRFPHLTALAVAGQLTGSVGALAEAVAPTGIRELDLRGVWDHTDAEHERVCELLGDRVRIAPPGDAIPF